jgi:peptidoglycan hydrolase-like protein with peptidoglycan-binding domain
MYTSPAIAANFRSVKMDPLTVLTLISTAVQVAGSVKALLDQGGVTKQSLQTTVPQIIPQLTELGAALFPKVAPAMQVVAAASATFDPNVTKWLQIALNKLVSPSPNLVVDGVYGPRTREAVEAAQKKLGITVDGWAGEITQGAIQTALSKL